MAELTLLNASNRAGISDPAPTGAVNQNTDAPEWDVGVFIYAHYGLRFTAAVWRLLP